MDRLEKPVIRVHPTSLKMGIGRGHRVVNEKKFYQSINFIVIISYMIIVIRLDIMLSHASLTLPLADSSIVIFDHLRLLIWPDRLITIK